MRENSAAAQRESRTRDLGIEQAVVDNQDLLVKARACARYYAANLIKGGLPPLVDSDIVNRLMHARHGIETIGNVAGAIFRTGEWEFTGEYKLSTKRLSHRRPVRIWRFVGGGE